MIEYGNYLYQHPDPEKVDEYILPNCTCFQDTVDKLSGLQERSWHVDGDDVSIVSVALLDRSDPNVAILDVVLKSNNRPIVDSHGGVKEAGIVGPPRHITYVLRLQNNGEWRIYSRDYVGDAQ